MHYNRLSPYLGDNDDQPAQKVRQCVASERSPAFETFWENAKAGQKFRHGVTTEVDKDLFEVTRDHTLACSVPEDLDMSRGIARVFRYKFGEPQPSSSPQGRALRLPKGRQQAYCLVVPDSSNLEEDYKALWDGLVELRDYMLEDQQARLAIPKMGGGRANRDWRIIRSMIEAVFSGVGISVMVCCEQAQPRASGEKSVDCHFFLTTGCRRGAACPYLHRVKTVPGRNSLGGG